MAKKKQKKTTISKSKYKHAGVIKFLAAIGAAVSIVYHVLGLINGIGAGSPDIVRALVFPILAILVDLVLLGSLQLINHKFVFEMTWLTLLILGIVEAIFHATYGTILIVVAAFIALIDRL